MLRETPEARSEVAAGGLEPLYFALGCSGQRVHLCPGGPVLAAGDDPDRAGKGIEGRERTALRNQRASPRGSQAAGAAEEIVQVEPVQMGGQGIQVSVGLRVGEEQQLLGRIG